MTIYEIANTVIRGEKTLVFPLTYSSMGTEVRDAKGDKVLDIRGWGHLQYADDNKGAELQDGIGEWVVKTLNDAYENQTQKVKCLGSCGEIVPRDIAENGGKYTESTRAVVHVPKGNCHHL